MPAALLMREQVRDNNVALAALFFDRVHIVVPGRMDWPLLSAQPPTPFMRDLESFDIVKIHTLDRDHTEITGARLIESIEDLRDQLRERYAFDGEAWPKSGERAYTVTAPWYSTTLKAALLEHGLAFQKTNTYQQYDYLRIPSPVGRIYFSALVEHLASNFASSPTGNKDHWILGAGSWDKQEVREILRSMLQPPTVPVIPRNEQSGVTATGMYGMLAVQMAIPKHPALLSPKFIADFRNQQRGALTTLQEYLTKACGPDGEIVKTSSLLASRSDIRELLLIDYQRHLMPALSELKRELRSSRVDLILDSISLKAALPPSIAATLSLILSQGPVMTGLGLGGGLALSVAESWRKHFQAKTRIKKDSPVHYLLSLHRDSRREIGRSHRQDID
ncbi:hypothetical protein AB0H37_08215 [Actinomadura sp. NPDC023710]|uniref:hypothetical protein n=1 Tax=Actinomadura sp. NPDC023710 TaxID=3158219 RepID=UPI0033EE3041